MQGVLPQWTPWDKYLSKFPNTVSFVIIPGEICRKLVKSIYPTNLLKVVVFLPKSNARFQLKKVCKQLALCQENILSPETTNQWDSGTSLRQRQRVKISQEKSPIAETFFFQYLDCSVEH